VEIRTICPDEWRELRDLRLRALKDAPDAFGATYDEEAASTDEAWRHRADRPDGTMIVAVDEDGRFIGMGSGGPAPDAPAYGAIYGMWVEPSARGKGVGEGIIREIAAWARAAGYEEIGLGVTIGNGPAIALYDRLGFRDTGLRYPLREGTDLEIQLMVTSLDELAAYFAT
jgi:ribosomal protein S18 acetylase RimI-like enzyme